MDRHSPNIHCRKYEEYIHRFTVQEVYHSLEINLIIPIQWSLCIRLDCVSFLLFEGCSDSQCYTFLPITLRGLSVWAVGTELWLGLGGSAPRLPFWDCNHSNNQIWGKNYALLFNFDFSLDISLMFDRLIVDWLIVSFRVSRMQQHLKITGDRHLMRIKRGDMR